MRSNIGRYSGGVCAISSVSSLAHVERFADDFMTHLRIKVILMVYALGRDHKNVQRCRRDAHGQVFWRQSTKISVHIEPALGTKEIGSPKNPMKTPDRGLISY